ncbi:hypothetical protein FQN57_005514 [Myotisia sp. PD_48]|nr:hypothetical protein FQN57_005514 [Myotisia sp. PD_48]
MKAPKSKTKGSKVEDKVLSKVKDAGVKKAAESPKAKAKVIAKKVSEKEEKKQKKKKAPTPSESSSSEDEDVKDASSSSSSESESEAEVKSAPAKKVVEASSSDSDSSDSSEDEKPAKKNGVAAAKAKADSSSEEDSSESESESEAKAPAKKDVKVAKKAESESDASDSDSSDSDSEEAVADKSSKETSESKSDESDEASSSESESEKEKPQKKRKAESEEPVVAKKAKTQVPEGASANLFVGNLSWNVDEEWLRTEFEEFGEASARIVTDRDSGRSRGFGYVEFANIEDAVKAYNAKKDTELDGRTINLDYANARTNNANGASGQDRAQSRAKSFGDSTSPESDTLFLGNLSFGADENMVQELFSQHGSILGIRLPTDQESGRPKGFGYIQFSSVDEARTAFEAQQGADLAGRAIRLDYSSPRQNSGGDRGGRGGGRGGGGGFGGRGRGGPRGGSRGGPRGGGRGGRGGSTNRGGFGDFAGKKTTF